MGSIQYPGKREIRHLWYAIGISLILSADRISVELSRWLQRYIIPYTHLSIAEYLDNFLFFWLLGLLALAYRDWVRALQRERELRRILASIGPDTLLVVSPDCRILMCSETVQSMFGYRPDEVIAQFTTILYEDRREQWNRREVRDALNTTGFHFGQAMGKHRSGREFPLEVVTSGLKGGPGAVVLIRDITQRKAMEDELLLYQHRLEDLVKNRTVDLNRANEHLKEELTVRRQMEREILGISGREKRRIGQDLHDTLGQELVGISFMVKALERKLRAAGVEAAEETMKIGELIVQAMQQTRRIARGLSPVDVVENGLASALGRLADDTVKMFGMKCEFAGDASCLIHDEEVANHLYHIAQEAVSNAVRHGNPTRIVIRLSEDGDGGQLIIEDNGTGLADAPKAHRGMGLHIMKYRAEAVGGSLMGEQPEYGGMRVVCRFVNRTAPASEAKES